MFGLYKELPSASRSLIIRPHAMGRSLAILLLMGAIGVVVHAGHKCVWVHGTVKCNKDPVKHANVEIRVYDKDGIGPLQLIDPDDLMGVTFSNDDGTFQLEGCGDDHDWLPGVANYPEPYIRIRHYCNSEQGEILMLDKFRVFVPDTYEIGTIELDPKNG